VAIRPASHRSRSAGKRGNFTQRFFKQQFSGNVGIGTTKPQKILDITGFPVAHVYG
jgi:hypothetical protein